MMIKLERILDNAWIKRLLIPLHILGGRSTLNKLHEESFNNDADISAASRVSCEHEPETRVTWRSWAENGRRRNTNRRKIESSAARKIDRKEEARRRQLLGDDVPSPRPLQKKNTSDDARNTKRCKEESSPTKDRTERQNKENNSGSDQRDNESRNEENSKSKKVKLQLESSTSSQSRRSHERCLRIMGEFIPSQRLAEKIKQKIAEKEEEKEQKKQAKYEKKRREKVMFLQTEAKLLNLNSLITAHLALEDSEVEKCISAMTELDTMMISALMLKKNPELVITVRKCRAYRFDERIRLKGEYLYNKFKAMFIYTDGENFSQVFESETQRFQEALAKSGKKPGDVVTDISVPSAPVIKPVVESKEDLAHVHVAKKDKNGSNSNPKEKLEAGGGKREKEAKRPDVTEANDTKHLSVKPDHSHEDAKFLLSKMKPSAVKEASPASKCDDHCPGDESSDPKKLADKQRLAKAVETQDGGGDQSKMPNQDMKGASTNLDNSTADYGKRSSKPPQPDVKDEYPKSEKNELCKEFDKKSQK